MRRPNSFFLKTAFLLGIVLGGCRTAPPSLQVLAEQGGGSLYACGSQQLLMVRGTPFEMGFQHGRLLAADVRAVVEDVLQWTESRGLTREHLRAIHASLEPHVPNRYSAELAGLAAGSGVPLEDLELLHALPSRFHCSGAAVAGSMTRDGKLYHSRSLDYFLDMGITDRIQNHALLIVRVPADGIPSAVPAWAGFLGAVTGMNLSGISIGEKGSSSRDESYDGMPMIFTVREALRRGSTLEQTVEIFRAGPRTCGFNYIVGSGDEGEAVALEVTRSHFAVFGFGDPAEDVAPHTALPDAVRRSNHFVDPTLAGTQREEEPLDNSSGSWQKYAGITDYLLANRGKLDAESMVAMLRLYPADHSCLHQAVMCSTDRVIWISQAVDDRLSATPGAQNQTFYGYDLRALIDGGGTAVRGVLTR